MAMNEMPAEQPLHINGTQCVHTCFSMIFVLIFLLFFFRKDMSKMPVGSSVDSRQDKRKNFALDMKMKVKLLMNSR